jgi:hypothetical protein
MMITIEPGTIAQFGRQLIDFGDRTASNSPTRTYRLPRVELAVKSEHQWVFDMCDRALVHEDAYARGAHHLNVAVIDRQSNPDAPRATWPSGVQSPIPTLHSGLAGTGLDGAYDVDCGVWHFADIAAGRAVQLMRAPKVVPPWEASFPLRDFIHWGLQHSGARLVHAATLGIAGKGVLIVGQGGAGKSGTTLAGILSGLDSVGDDYVAMTVDEDSRVHAYPLMKLVKQDRAGLDRLGLDPGDIGAQGPNWQNKYEFDFADLGRGKRAQSLELGAILMPTISGGETTSFEPVSARTAMIALAPSNLQQLPGGWREGMAFTASVARHLPAFRMSLSRDASEIARTIQVFIETHL